MANALYPKGKEKLLNADIDLLVDTIKVALVTDAYTYSSAHEFFSSLSTAGTPQTLGTKTTANGVFDAADATFSAVTVGSNVIAVAIYKDTGTGSTSPLIAYIDTVTGVPAATNGGDIVVQWDNGAYKIFSL